MGKLHFAMKSTYSLLPIMLRLYYMSRDAHNKRVEYMLGAYT